MNKKNRHFLSYVISFVLYVFFAIYELLESVVNYILLHIKGIKKFIHKYKELIYDSKAYTFVKLKIDPMNEKVYLSMIVFLVVSSGLLIYVMPFIIKSSLLKLISIIIGKVLSTTNLIVSGMGIKKIFKIPVIRFLRIKVSKIKRAVKEKLTKFKEPMKKIVLKIKQSTIYKKVKELFANVK